jgi:hypothetical protein
MFKGRRQPSCDGTSRMTRECQVRICERLGVKFPGPTRPCANVAVEAARSFTSALPRKRTFFLSLQPLWAACAPAPAIGPRSGSDAASMRLNLRISCPNRGTFQVHRMCSRLTVGKGRNGRHADRSTVRARSADRSRRVARGGELSQPMKGSLRRNHLRMALMSSSASKF